jgi:hypothetical protein
LEVPCANGFIDLVNEDTIVEVKNLKQFPDALGQIMLYSMCMPNRKKRVHLFGEEDEDGPNVRKARKLFEYCDVTCTYERHELVTL